MLSAPCWSREAVAAAPGAPGHVLSYMHSLEVMQRYSQVLAAARDLLSITRCASAWPMHFVWPAFWLLCWLFPAITANLTMAHAPRQRLALMQACSIRQSIVSLYTSQMDRVEAWVLAHAGLHCTYYNPSSI